MIWVTGRGVAFRDLLARALEGQKIVIRFEADEFVSQHSTTADEFRRWRQWHDEGSTACLFRKPVGDYHRDPAVSFFPSCWPESERYAQGEFYALQLPNGDRFPPDGVWKRAPSRSVAAREEGNRNPLDPWVFWETEREVENQGLVVTIGVNMHCDVVLAPYDRSKTEAGCAGLEAAKRRDSEHGRRLSRERLERRFGFWP